MARGSDGTDELRTTLSRSVREKDRALARRSLREAKFLSCIPLDDSGSRSVVSAEHDVASERRIVLNGIKFLGGRQDRGSSSSGGVGVGDGFLRELREVCRKLCETTYHNNVGAAASARPSPANFDPDALYDALIPRMARSSASTDSQSTLSDLFGSTTGLVLVPVGTTDHRGGRGVVGSSADPTPLRIDLFVESGSVHAFVSSTHVFGLYRKEDAPDATGGGGAGKPWVSVEATVEEKVNFATGARLRYLCVKALDPYR